MDMYVNRISKRLGLVLLRVVFEKVEEYLIVFILKEKWIYVNYVMVDYGRSICWLINFKCEECLLREFCFYVKGFVIDEDIKGNVRKFIRDRKSVV